MYRLSQPLKSNKASLNKLYQLRHHTSHNDISIQHLQRLRYNFEDTKQNNNHILYPIVGTAIGSVLMSGILLKTHYQNISVSQNQDNESMDDEHTVMNYSGTHIASPIHYFSPSSSDEVEHLVSYCNENNIPFRPMGSGISPNGIGFGHHGIMDMSNCNKILNIDQDKMQITVEAGIKVKDVIKAIIPYDMALENIPSIQEQQIGGLMQVGAHGTGINIAPCDMQVVSMTIVTPNDGKLVLTPKDELFYYARVGLGSIGVVTEVTLQCVKRHKLAEFMWVMDVEELVQKRNELINKYKHIKFLWVPYVDDKVIVIAANEMNEDKYVETICKSMSSTTEIECQKSLRELYKKQTGLNDLKDDLSFADLRDILLGINNAKHVLDTDWIKEINCAELKYWQNVSNKYDNLEMDEAKISELPEQIDFSENVLSFQCGGQQWVYEICFPIHKYDNNEIPLEIQFTMDVLDKIKQYDIPAPSPLEQRFTSSSSSYLSPSYSNNINDKFCWFGIIFYIPTQDEQKRRWIANEFHTYSRILDDVADQYGAIGHWAKIETHFLKKHERIQLHNRLKNRFGDKLNKFLQIRNKYDPKGILINDVISDLFHI